MVTPKTKASAHRKAAPSGDPLDRIKARDVMQTQLVTVETTTPLAEVEQLLGEHRISGLPVTNEAGHVVGVLSTRDLLERYAEDPDTRRTPAAGFYEAAREEVPDEDFPAFELDEEATLTAGDVMNSEVFAVDADAPLREVAAAMVQHNVHRLLVLEKRRHVGLISTFDLLRGLLR